MDSKAATWLTPVSVALTVGLAGLIVLERASFFLMTGSLWPITKVEPLVNAVAVRSWSPSGLHLNDGRTMLPRGMASLPQTSTALLAVTRRGVEVGADGTVVGQVEVFHGCGNDPVRLDLRRVDIAHLLTFMREGKSKLKLDPDEAKRPRPLLTDRGMVAGVARMSRSVWDPGSP